MTNSLGRVSEVFLILISHRMDWDLTLIRSRQDSNPGWGVPHLETFTNPTTSGDSGSNIFNFKQNIGKYLGIHNIVFWKDPLNASKLLLVRVQKKLAGWKSSTLSGGCKLTMLKSNLSGMPNHILSCFKSLASLTNKLEAECGKFFWGEIVLLTTCFMETKCVFLRINKVLVFVLLLALIKLRWLN